MAAASSPSSNGGWTCCATSCSPPPAPRTSAAALTMPSERQERRRRRQFAHDRQPPPWMRTTFTADMNMDVGEEVSSAAAPWQLPSGMVIRAPVRHVDAADLAPAASVVMHDHVDLAAASLVHPRTPRVVLGNASPPATSHMTCLLWAGASSTSRCTRACSSLESTRGVRRPTCVAYPPRALLPTPMRRCIASSSSAPTSLRSQTGSCGCGWPSLHRGLLPRRVPRRC